MSQPHSAAVTAGSLCLPFPMREGKYLAQIVIPRDMTKAEAERLCAFIRSLIAPSPQLPASPTGGTAE